MKIKRFTLLIIVTCLVHYVYGQADPKDVIRRAEEQIRGVQSSKITSTVTIVRKTWTREMTLKTWSKGGDYSLILITNPPRDKGTVFLKRQKEIWNWIPSIERIVKLPPSMMMQSWMGSDLTNDDLVRESSTIEDYDHQMLSENAIIDGKACYQIELIPHDNAPVVWGKLMIWISKDDYFQLKTEMYDEDEELVTIMWAKDIKELGGRRLPTRMEVIPTDKEEQKTILTYQEMEFDVDIEDDFFSVQNMKRIR